MADSTPASLPGREVGEQQAGDAERVGVAEEALEAVPQDGIEVAEDDDRAGEPARSISASVPASVIPWRSASKVERWMVGPSASGSLNGTPTSMMSATSSAARSAARLASADGYPAVR